MKKTGIFGGTFNPPHREHIEICRAAMAELGLERIVILPTSIPPHKKVWESEEARRIMTELTFDEDGFIIDLYEQENPGVHYSVDTLRVMRQRYGDVTFIIGGDSAIDFFKWRQPEAILQENEIAVCGRFGREAELFKAVDALRAKGGRVNVLSYVGGNVSSTLVRYVAALRADLKKYVTDDVANYITQNGLYRDYDELLSKVRERVNKERYAHTVRTAVKALELNGQLGLDPQKVFLSAVLHDVGKNEKRIGVPSDAVDGPVAHQFSGAMIAETEFGVTDEDVLGAIACHTTGKPDMTTLDKLIFVADLVEDGRDYAEVEELRRAVNADFDSGFRLIIERDYAHLKAVGRPIYHLTEKAYEFYKNKER